VSHIHNPRDIIDRRSLLALIEGGDEDESPDATRARLVEALKGALKDGTAIIRERLEQGRANGIETVAAHSYLMDQIIRVLFDVVTTRFIPSGNRTTGERLSIVALGGYGRGELSPLSDVDLLFLLPYKETPFSEQLVEFMLYVLWDLGLKVGQAVRSVTENIVQAKADMTIRTTLVDARWVWGDQDLVAELKARFQKEVVEGTIAQFVGAKLAERDARHQKLGDTRYRLEPNVKEDRGALRDLHTLGWIARYVYGTSDMRKLADQGVIETSAATQYLKAYEFFSAVRCYIHYIAGRPENRLTFDLQREIAPRLGYHDRAGATATERFMKHYFLMAREVEDLTRIFLLLLETVGRRKPFYRLSTALRRRKIDGFIVERGRIGVAKETAFADDPIKLLRIFKVAQDNGLEFQPRALRQISANARRVAALRDNMEANQIFMEILCSPKSSENILRLMSECEIFGRFIPDFARVVAQMQYDMYHVYTTDEHTIRAIGILNRIEQGSLKDELPVASDIVHKIESRRALYVAVMLHDIAKGRGGDHSDIGADIALTLCPRLGLTPEETETVSWLVRTHLLMSNTAFKRDLDDRETIVRFCEVVQSPERLKLLLILTCADIRAVGPAVWNNWKATLLRDLYHRAMEHMTGEQATAGASRTDHRVTTAKEALAVQLKTWTAAEIETHLAIGSPAYWLAYDTAAHIRHAGIIRAAEAKGDKIAIDFAVDQARAVTEMLIYAPDHAGLFARIAGALSLSGVSVVDAKILTLANGMALDTFFIQDFNGEALSEPDKQARVTGRVVAALEGRIRLNQELATAATRLPARAQALEVPPRVIIDNTASKVCSVVEINGHDRPGFLFDVTRAIADLGLQIASAHISTYGERVVDVFYVKDVFGMKVEHETKILKIREALGKAIGVAASDVSVERRKKARPAKGSKGTVAAE
jgi:[protein-PII] uridylyltransferase